MEIPFGNRGVPPEVLHNFRTEFSENYLTFVPLDFKPKFLDFLAKL